MIKLICTVLYLITSVVALRVRETIRQRELEELRGSGRDALIRWLLSILTMVLVFAQFWLLSREFPVYVILLLVAASLVASMIYLLIGALAGFTLPEKVQKIGALQVIWSFERGFRRSRMVLFFAEVQRFVLLFVLLVSSIGSLAVFWRYPIGDPYAKGLIVLFQFMLPWVVMLPVWIASAWPLITSEFLDNDVRNAGLVDSFSWALTATIFILFPVWVYKTELSSLFETLPPFWLLLSIPLLFFLLGGIFPYVIGMFRFRAQVRLLLTWRKKWMSELLNLSRLPADVRSAEVEEKRRQLENELDRRISDDKLLQMYQAVLEDKQTQARLPPGEQQLEVILDIIAQNGPPGAIGEKFTVSQQGYEEVSHEQRPLYMEKQRVVQYGTACTYGCTILLCRTTGPCDRAPRSL
jgi:hypothetical protein